MNYYTKERVHLCSVTQVVAQVVRLVSSVQVSRKVYQGLPTESIAQSSLALLAQATWKLGGAWTRGPPCTSCLIAHRSVLAWPQGAVPEGQDLAGAGNHQTRRRQTPPWAD